MMAFYLQINAVLPVENPPYLSVNFFDGNDRRDPICVHALHATSISKRTKPHAADSFAHPDAALGVQILFADIALRGIEPRFDG